MVSVTVWTTERVEERIVDVLGEVAEGVDGHHFGPPFVTAYQLAIALDRRYPQIRRALGVELGGEGIGERHSLTQYLGRELSGRIRGNADYPVEGRMLSNADVIAIDYRHDGEIVRSSLTGSSFDLSMYRLRPASA